MSQENFNNEVSLDADTQNDYSIMTAVQTRAPVLALAAIQAIDPIGNFAYHAGNAAMTAARNAGAAAAGTGMIAMDTGISAGLVAVDAIYSLAASAAEIVHPEDDEYHFGDVTVAAGIVAANAARNAGNAIADVVREFADGAANIAHPEGSNGYNFGDVTVAAAVVTGNALIAAAAAAMNAGTTAVDVVCEFASDTAAKVDAYLHPAAPQVSIEMQDVSTFDRMDDDFVVVDAAGKDASFDSSIDNA